MRSCGCRDTQYDNSGRVLMVSTCPFCLPVGAISHLIENGRQLDMFELTEGDEIDRVDILRSVSGSIPYTGDDHGE